MTPDDTIRSRHVFYLKGYDQLGTADYYSLFKREYDRYLGVWSLDGTLGSPKTDPDNIASSWSAETNGPNWRVLTSYEFLDWNDIVARDLARSSWARLPRTFLYYLEYLLDGTLFRIFRADWRFGLFHLYPVIFLSLAIVVPFLIGLSIASWLSHVSIAGTTGAVLAGIATCAFGCFVAMRLATRYYAAQLAEGWMWCRDWAREKRPDVRDRVDVFAQRIVEKVRANDVDEIIVIGHSAGGALAIWVIARALEICGKDWDPRQRVVLATVGSVHPLAALYSRDGATRAAIARIATEKKLLWVDFQARKDVVSFFRFDSVSDAGISVGTERGNPVVFLVSMRDLLSNSFYRLQRWNPFRVHHQFIMANDRRARYDYFMFICGPLPLAMWARDDFVAMMSFTDDATLRPQAWRMNELSKADLARRSGAAPRC